MKNLILIVSVLLLLGIKLNAQVAIIANKSVSESSISSNKASEIYLSRVKTWSDGTKIIRFMLKSENGTTDKFFGVVGKSFADMKKIWMKLQLTGEGAAPEALGSDEEIINKVSSTPGAIGFIDAKKVTDKVKVLLTIN